jgi:hypothetical protein
MLSTLERAVKGGLPRPWALVVTWRQPSDLRQLRRAIAGLLKRRRRSIRLVSLNAYNLTAESFSRRLAQILGEARARSTCLLVHHAEPFAPRAAEVLNGFRERLSELFGVIIALREDRDADFIAHSPDLMAWVGPNLMPAAHLVPILSLKDVQRALRAFQSGWGMTSTQFARRYDSGELRQRPEAWFWRELIELQRTLRKAKP